MTRFHETDSPIPSHGDIFKAEETVNQPIGEKPVVASDSVTVDKARLTSCFHPNAGKSGSESVETPHVVVAVPDCDSKDSNSQPAWQKPKDEIKRLTLKDLSGEELADLAANCTYFTAYAHLPKSSRGYHRQRDQDRHERAGHAGPEDILAAALRKIAKRRREVESRSTQVELDLFAPTESRKTSQNPASVTDGISLLAHEGKLEEVLENSLRGPAAEVNDNLDAAHLAEWVRGSAVDEELTRLNLRSTGGEEVFQLLRPNVKPEDEQADRNRLKTAINRGWLCTGLHPFSHGIAKTWGCFKPDEARKVPDSKGGLKPLKYEHPKGVATKPFFLAFPRHVGEKIAKNARKLAAYKKWEDEKERTPQERWFYLLSVGVTLHITEGAKKAASMLSAGYLCIAVPGIWNGCWKPGVRHELRREIRAALALGVTKVRIAFDYSEKEQGVIDVQKAADRLASCIRQDMKSKVAVEVMDLPGPERKDWGLCKGLDDIRAAHGDAGVDAVVKEALPLTTWRAKNVQVRVMQRLRAPLSDAANRPTKTVSSQYFAAKDIPEDAKLVAMIGRMETGKTHALVDYVNITRLPVFIPLHRRGLAGNIAQRFHIPYQSEGKLVFPWETGKRREVQLPPKDLNPSFRNYYASEIEAQREAEENGKVVVLDSSHIDGSSYLDPESCRNALIILDEADAGVWHLLTGDTEIKQHRTEVVENLTLCLRNARQVIAASAHLHEDVISYLEKILKVQANVLINDHKPAEGRKAFLYEKNTQWLEALYATVQSGANVYVATTSQKSDSVYAAKNLAAMLEKDLKVPADQILVVDSSTTRTTDHEARGVVTDPSLLLKYRVVLCTPVVETGVSVDDHSKHFDAVFAINSGIGTPQSAVQSIGRVRSDVPRHIFACRNGRTVFGGAMEPTGLLKANQTRAANVRDSLMRAGVADTELPVIENLHTEAWASLAADQNLVSKPFGFAVSVLLREEGYQLIETCGADEDLAKTLRDRLKEVGAENTEKECLAVSTAAPAVEDAIEELEKKPELTLEEQAELEHGRVCRDYGVETADELQVYSHRRGGFRAFRTEMFLEEMSRTAENESDAMQMVDALTAMKRKGMTKGGFLGDYVRAFQHPSVQLLHGLGALELVQRRDEFTMADKDMVLLHEHAKRRRDECRMTLGIDPCVGNPSTFFNALAERLGYKLDRLSQRKDVGGKRHHKYVVKDLFAGVERGQLKANIKANIQQRYNQAREFAIGDDNLGLEPDPSCTQQQVDVVLYREQHLRAIDMLEDGF